MSTVEIAERTGKSHAHVMRDVRVMLEELGEGQSKFGSPYRAGNGKQEPCYLLPRRECVILVTGYSILMRAAVVDRWAELEAATVGPALPNFADLAASTRAWAERWEDEQRVPCGRLSHTECAQE